MKENEKIGMGDLLTMPKAAQVIGVGVRTLYRYLDSGEIPRSVRLPGRRLVYRADLQSFVDRHVKEHPSTA